MTLVPITTERLRIRALSKDDLAAVFAIVGDETVADGATWLSLSVARKIGLVHGGETIEDERGTKLIFRSP